MSLPRVILAAMVVSAGAARGALTDGDALKLLFANLHNIEADSAGLYSLDNDTVVVGPHRIQLQPVIERQAEIPGKAIVALRVDVRLDGRARPEATVGVIGISESAADAASIGLGEWHLGLGMPLFRALKGNVPADLAIGNRSAYAGLLALRGEAPGKSWIDGGAAMHEKFLQAMAGDLPEADLVVLDLKVSVQPDAPVASECRINGEISSRAAAAVLKLDWPRSGEGYVLKQRYVLTPAPPRKLGAHFPFPEHWWAPVAQEGAPAWEILPQEAKPGEVILSKRHELGILSNFAATPFYYRGKRYASLEGFWQMMKYPEGTDDPRATAAGVKWAHTRADVAQMTAFDAKRAGDLGEANMKAMSIDWVSFEGDRFPYKSAKPGEHHRLIVAAMREKLAQNPEVQKILLSTGDLVLKPDHHQSPDDPPEWRYFEIWMQLRTELQTKP